MRTQSTNDIFKAFMALAVGLVCLGGAFFAIRDDNRFLAIVLSVFALAACGVAIAIIIRNVRVKS